MALEVSLDLSKMSIPQLRTRLNDGNADIRAEAAALLGERGVREALPDLIRLVHDPNFNVRIEAIGAIQDIGIRRDDRLRNNAFSAIIAALNDDIPMVKEAAAEALGSIATIRDFPVRAALGTVARNPNETKSVRDAAEEAIEQMRRNVVPRRQ